MSALGQKRTFAAHKPMSALPPKADMCGAKRDVHLVPIADMARPSPRTERRPQPDRLRAVSPACVLCQWHKCLCP